MNDEKLMQLIRDFFKSLEKAQYKQEYIRKYYTRFMNLCRNIDDLKLSVEKIDYVNELDNYFLNIKSEWKHLQVNPTHEVEVNYRDEIFAKIKQYQDLSKEIKNEKINNESLILQKEEVATAKEASKKATRANIFAIIAIIIAVAGFGLTLWSILR
ncbi:MAG: hypothetical protein ACTSP7_05360 [Candidatus Heimdallarchaeota archaeon]